ncbi:hypothetical protein [Actinoplanes sp. L3-i22]|uniref:hypothetical protein n=1 Tax=Actinoplanes sp. L3-i22 TaxID=2836373 RepID=UPI001C7536E2|nr:hypothetical protein [Actinoplanes sp. L3-i22]BCY11933.1 hypothetical protein L3i22_070210 [Actinoplanes sp. L3-i22]
MGELSARLDRVLVHASAPGGGVHGEIRGRGDVDIHFSSGFYGSVADSELERRLGQIAQLLWVEYLREQRAIRSELGIFEFVDDPVRDTRFTCERDRITATGQSDDGRISVSTEGMRRWRVSVADGTVRLLSEHDFRAGLRTAVVCLIADQSRQIIELKGRVYG